MSQQQSPKNTAPSEDRAELLKRFVASSPRYYLREFNKIGATTAFVFSFNAAAAALGPVWFGLRGLWKWGMLFVVAETFALTQIMRGLFGDLSGEARARIGAIEGTLDLRRRQLQAALEDNSDKVGAIRGWIDSLEREIANIRLEMRAVEESAVWVAAAGLGALLAVKCAQGLLANRILEKRFSEWLSDRSLKSGLAPARIALSGVFVVFVYCIGILFYGFNDPTGHLGNFPTDPRYRLAAINWIVEFFSWLTGAGSGLFYFISYGIRVFLDYLEVLFVRTPWPIVASFIILLTGLTAGARGAVFAAGSLAFMGALEFWEKAMTTLALLGTAACISITIGIPLGVLCAKRERLYGVIRPVMDFMQTMPSFVFMIPVIALFSVGKPAAIIITMIFGGTPVVRLTVLGLRGVPQPVREAAIAFGASKWYLLTKVDLPLAAPSIFAGINQTIMLSLAMVVVASLIGAKGLGEDVLEALQYANVGQGILAGFAILFCAMILNRIIQGGNR
ncbi:MAG: ABC transporter permease subunit [Gammaproteobacteria bacterium]|nr:ABC transporter permease subunit [Gammaproteobacteria bacterium]CAJ2376554.1 MAG: L-proline glycine betaine ABC transport system permease protein ProW (TC 3.A.1.12.1) [Arenicellales bacterium IbO2]MDA7961025.1 ABC transporter permease subunit [Gammaproteobacteria bacterium]MDA7968965.1 ABC transporter permease subunit [Gammaproteobacteria bacterium]MDA7969940.1 ABC transporter permease subunit [Gammaproteobacteria bacterium]